MTELVDGFDLHLQLGYLVVRPVKEPALDNPIPAEILVGQKWLGNELIGPGTIVLVSTDDGIMIQKEGEHILEVKHFIVPEAAIIGYVTKKEDDGGI